MLDPQLSTYALAVAVASGVVAAGAYATALAGRPEPWPPRRQLVGQLLSTALLGAGVVQVARWLPIRIDVLSVLIASAILGHVAGPRGPGWLAEGGIQNLRRVPGLKVPDLPPESGPPEPPESPEKSEPAPQEAHDA